MGSVPSFSYVTRYGPADLHIKTYHIILIEHFAQIESLRPIAESEWTNTLNSYHDRVVENIKWRAKNEPLVRAWLKAKTFSVNQKN